MGDFKKWEGNDFEMGRGGGVDTPLRTMQFELISHIIVLRGFFSMFKKETAKRYFLVCLGNGSKKEKKIFHH